MRDKHQIIEEPCEVKVSRTVLKTNGVGDNLVEFNYYVTLSLDYKTVPTIKPDFNPDNIVGIDVGLINFYVASDNTRIAAPKHLRRSERKLKSAQRRVSRRKKGSNRRRKAIKQLGVKHKKVADTRKDFHFKIAKSLLSCLKL